METNNQPISNQSVLSKKNPDVVTRTLLYVFLFMIVPWPLFFAVNIAGLFLVGFATVPFSLDFQKYDSIVRIISTVCIVLPYIMAGVLYFIIENRFLFKATGSLHLVSFFITISPTIAFKIIVLNILSQASFFSSHEPLNTLSMLAFVSLELVIIVSTFSASLYEKLIRVKN